MSRILVTTPQTWFIDNVNGNDCNDGSSAAFAFQTTAAAQSYVFSHYTFGPRGQPIFQLAHGTYPQIVLSNYIGANSWLGLSGYFHPKFLGDPVSPGLVLIAPTSGDAIVGVNCDAWMLDSLTVQAAAGNGINCDAESHILARNITLNACSAAHVLAQHDGWFEWLTGPFTVAGSASCHAYAHLGGRIYAQGSNTCVLQGMQTFANFAIADGLGLIDYTAVTYSGGCNPCPVVQASGGILLPPPSPPGAWP